MILLTRDQFREAVFKRDGHLCVNCKNPAVDAHHILERRLFPDSGYYIDNGASVCTPCHILAEQTVLSCEDLREKAGIKKIILPPQLYDDTQYTKWGDTLLSDGTRTRGELFFDPSVQKILAPVLHLYRQWVKYPRTWHLPWSPGMNDDDRMLDTTDHFKGKEVIAFLKLDGENCSMYRDHIHARAVDSRSHPSRDIVKSIHGRICHEIPEGWRFNGENMYATHSIHYKNLESYFYLFKIWNEKNECLSWDETVEWGQLLGLSLCPILWRGIYDENILRNLYKPTYEGNECEGYVLHLAGRFNFRDYKHSVAKMVRKGHVQTHGHWMRQKLIPNELKGADNDQSRTGSF